MSNLCDCGRPLEKGRRFKQGCLRCARILNEYQDDPDMMERRAKGRPEVWEDLYDVGRMVEVGEAQFYARRNERVPKSKAWM